MTRREDDRAGHRGAGRSGADIVTDGDVAVALRRIVDVAVEHLEPCEAAGISAVHRRQLTSSASSNDLPRLVDAIQDEAVRVLVWTS
jgi:hypothetical protein